MRFKNREIILFDLDGTLIDSAPDLAAAVNETMAKLGRETYDEATVRAWVGNGAGVLVKRALSGSRDIDENLSETLFEEALAIFMASYRKRLCDATALYPGVRETLERLEALGLKMAVVTNKPGPFVAPILEKLEIGRFFDLTLGGEDLPRKKPDPLPLLHACERLGASAGEALMVGDSKNDILAAKAAHIPCVAVGYGYNYGEDIAVHGPDAVIERMEELVEMVEA